MWVKEWEWPGFQGNSSGSWVVFSSWGKGYRRAVFPGGASCSSIMNIYTVIDIFVEMLQSWKMHAKPVAYKAFAIHQRNSFPPNFGVRLEYATSQVQLKSNCTGRQPWKLSVFQFEQRSRLVIFLPCLSYWYMALQILVHPQSTTDVHSGSWWQRGSPSWPLRVHRRQQSFRFFHFIFSEFSLKFGQFFWDIIYKEITLPFLFANGPHPCVFQVGHTMPSRKTER